MRPRDFDVLIAADFGRPEGTSVSVAQEIEVQGRMGLKTALVPIGPSHLAGPATWAGPIQNLVGAGLAVVVPPDQPVTGRLLVVRQPNLVGRADWHVAARADQVVMVADQILGPGPGATGDGVATVAIVQERLRAELGALPRWAPTSAIVRDALLASASSELELTPFDWHDVIDTTAWAPRQPRVRRRPVVIGRHARDAIESWPESPSDLLSAYPDSGARNVKILGGSAAACKVLRRAPRYWVVLQPGTMATEDFLASLDLYVYFHHSAWRDASARDVLEALAAGLPVITHRYLERVFGDACVYGEPGDAPHLAEELLGEDASRGGAPVLNQRGLDLVRERFDWEEHRRRLDSCLERRLPGIARRTARRRRILFTSSNGGGLGHLTRLLAIARQLPAEYEPLFLTQSVGFEAVRKLGFWVDYVPAQRKSGLDPRAWHAYLRARIGTALRVFRPEALVFDGTIAYQGLRQAMADFPDVHRIWCRRGMWKASGPDWTQRSLEHLAAFDLIIEPGDLAAAADRGITVQQRHLTRQVDPILLLGEEGILSREEARQELRIAPGAIAVLLNLADANISGIEVMLDEIARAFGPRPDVHLYALQSPIEKTGLAIDPDRFSRIETYPLARLIRAFDACIAAVGYNSFHELLANSVPTLFVPKETDLDDQAARAAWAAEQGLALLSRADDSEKLRRALPDLLDPAVRDRLRERCRELPGLGGARQAADLIAAQVQAAPARLQSRSAPGQSAPPPVVAVSRTIKRSPLLWLPRYVWLTGRRLLRRLRRLRREAQARRKRRTMNERTAAAPAVAWELVVADSALSARTRADELAAWIASRAGSAVIVAGPEAVPPLSRLGLVVEMATSQDAQEPGDRLDRAAYAREKTLAMVTAYGCGPVVHWPEAEAGKQAERAEAAIPSPGLRR